MGERWAAAHAATQAQGRLAARRSSTYNGHLPMGSQIPLMNTNVQLAMLLHRIAVLDFKQAQDPRYDRGEHWELMLSSPGTGKSQLLSHHIDHL